MRVAADRVAQAVDCLPSKHEALSSNTNASKKIRESGIRQSIARIFDVELKRGLHNLY
jgi:hypothetical protein